MAIEYLGLSEINGPLVVLEGVKNASFEEIVEFHMDDGTQKIGRIIEIYEDKQLSRYLKELTICPLATHIPDSPDIRWRSVFHRKSSAVPSTVSVSRSTDSVR